MKRDDLVHINTPENERLHGAPALVDTVEEWGCHLLTVAAATGRFRAAWHEMEESATPDPLPHVATMEGNGDICACCGGCNMTWAGSCKVCLDCGTSGGCS